MTGAYHVRELIQLNDDQLSLLPDLHDVVYDDGTQHPSYRNETRYSALFWNIFKAYPNSRISFSHHIASILQGDALDAGTHNKLCTNILRTIVHEENLFLPEQKEPLLKLIYKTISSAQSMLTTMTEEDVISLDILDFVMIANHPNILALKYASQKDEKKISFAYEQAHKEILTNHDFDNNNLAKAVRAKMVRVNQVMQCVLFRGFPSEVEGTIFKKAIWTNYTTGNCGFYELVADSRTAAKSHLYSDSALKDSEYNARKFQLYAMVLEKIVYQDCGSEDLMPWLVKGKLKDTSGATLYGGDLPLLIGKYYKIEKTDSYKVIKGDEEDLVGKTIWVRNTLTCKHPNGHEVCHVCAGKLSENISRFDNLGHFGTVSITRLLSQTILSFKHVNTSSIMTMITLDDYTKKYLNPGVKGEGFFLNKFKKGLKVYLSVARDDAPGLLDLNAIDNIAQLSLPRISAISQIKICFIDEDGCIEEVLLSTKVKQASAMLSRELLSYLSLHGWAVDADNNFRFDMGSWDYQQPILVMQNKEESVVDLVDQVEQMVQSNQQLHKKRLVVENAPMVLLQELFDLVNSKFQVNIFCFEVVVYGLMTKSKESFALARNAKEPVLGISRSLMIHRTLGPAMDFQAHEEALFNPAYFFTGERPDSVMDVFLAPRDVIDAYYPRSLLD